VSEPNTSANQDRPPDPAGRVGLGAEDVLHGHVPDLDEPDDSPYRTSFHRGANVLLAALVAVAALVAGLLVWWPSDIRATSAQLSQGLAAEPQPPAVFPPSLGETWRAPSSATPVPVAVGPSVVTGEGGEVAGRDPLTGEIRWWYRRDLTLCTVTSAWSLTVAVYRTGGRMLPGNDSRAGGGCSQAVALNPADGSLGQAHKPDEPAQRPNTWQRHTDAELGTRLIFDGTYLTTSGTRLLTTWRSDLVQTMEYGALPAVVNPNKQPRSDCTYGSVSTAPGRIGVIERCGTDPSDRLTVYRATGRESKSDEPDVVSSILVGTRGARVVAMSASRTAVLAPGPARLLVFDDQGQQRAAHRLDLPDQDLVGDPPGLVVPVAQAPGAVYWFTGSNTIALHGQELSPLWTIQNTLGPGTVFAGRMLVPVVDGIRVIDLTTGGLVGTAPVDRDGYTGQVTMSAIGPMVLEQRGATLVALR
jgi:hypothetical protein